MGTVGIGSSSGQESRRELTCTVRLLEYTHTHTYIYTHTPTHTHPHTCIWPLGPPTPIPPMPPIGMLPICAAMETERSLGSGGGARPRGIWGASAPDPVRLWQAAWVRSEQPCACACACACAWHGCAWQQPHAGSELQQESGACMQGLGRRLRCMTCACTFHHLRTMGATQALTPPHNGSHTGAHTPAQWEPHNRRSHPRAMGATQSLTPPHNGSHITQALTPPHDGSHTVAHTLAQ